MLKPSDKWNWYYSDDEGYLMMELDDNMLFRTNLSRNVLVECAFQPSSFSVDDASDYQTFKEHIVCLPLSEPRKAQLALYCVAAKRFHKPVQPKSWFFSHQGYGYEPQMGDVVTLLNEYNEGHFMVLDVGTNASLCALVDLDDFSLNGSKSLSFGRVIKVMHDRMACANHKLVAETIALVG